MLAKPTIQCKISIKTHVLSLLVECDSEGKCHCKENIVGDKCDEAAHEFYAFPNVQRML